MTSSPTSPSRTAFDRAEVVATYLDDRGLTPCELALCSRWIPPGARILDLGVGTGRTTPWLRARASSYVGIDVAPAMVAAARERHPGVDLRVGDAADLGEFAAGSIDAVVFSFNGIDYLSDLDRARCLVEIRRVLDPRHGVLVLSRHTPRAVIGAAPPTARGLGALARVAVSSVRRTARFVPTSAFWRGHGWILDPAQGGLLTHHATPTASRAELARHGLVVVDRQNGDLPRAPWGARTPWWYYVARPATIAR